VGVKFRGYALPNTKIYKRVKTVSPPAYAKIQKGKNAKAKNFNKKFKKGKKYLTKGNIYGRMQIEKALNSV
jgi:hypothetical protein